MEMLKLLATAAVLLALTPQWVDSTTNAISHSKGHVLMKVSCSTNWCKRKRGLCIPYSAHSSFHETYCISIVSNWILMNEGKI